MEHRNGFTEQVTANRIPNSYFDISIEDTIDLKKFGHDARGFYGILLMRAALLKKWLESWKSPTLQADLFISSVTACAAVTQSLQLCDSALSLGDPRSLRAKMNLMQNLSYSHRILEQQLEFIKKRLYAFCPEQIDKLSQTLRLCTRLAEETLKETVPQAISIHDAIREVIEIQRSDLEEKKIVPMYGFCDQDPVICSVPSDFLCVIGNLVNNAKEAMPAGGEIRIRTSIVDDENRQDAIIDIGDTGVGMDATTLRRLFKETFTSKGVGHGIGLSSVATRIRKNAGNIAVASSPGVGTTFQLVYPLA